MRAGELDRRVTVQSRTLSRDGVGGWVESWADLTTIWMGKKDVSSAAAGERFVSDQIITEVSTQFSAHYFTAQDYWPDTHRFKYRNRVYEILRRTEIGRQDGLIFDCKARGEDSFD